MASGEKMGQSSQIDLGFNLVSTVEPDKSLDFSVNCRAFMGTSKFLRQRLVDKHTVISILPPPQYNVQTSD